MSSRETNLPEGTEPEVVERLELEECVGSFLQRRKSPEWKPFPTGLAPLDLALDGGICRGEMVVIGARPSQGKTALLLELMHGIGKGDKCLLFSEEMSKHLLAKRVCHRIWGTPIPTNVEFDPGRMPDFWYDYWLEQKSTLVVESQRDIRRLRKVANETARERGQSPRIVGVDYLQLLKGRGRSRYEQITDVSMELRAMTNALKTATIVCAQLSRDVAKGGKQQGVRRPVLSDLRDSGQIEQDADIVLLLQWPWKDEDSKPKHEFKIYVAKNRNRAIVHPVVELAFDASYQRFMSLRDWSYRNPVDEGYQTG